MKGVQPPAHERQPCTQVGCQGGKQGIAPDPEQHCPGQQGACYHHGFSQTWGTPQSGADHLAVVAIWQRIHAAVSAEVYRAMLQGPAEREGRFFAF